MRSRRLLLPLALAPAIAALAGCSSSQRRCGAGDSWCGPGQYCVCADERCAAFDPGCESQFRYAGGACVETGFAGTAVPSSEEEHPACYVAADADADGDAGDADAEAEAEGDGDGDDGASDVRYCVTAMDCDDHNVCNGTETCNSATWLCEPGTPRGDGEACSLSGGLGGRCRASACIPVGCGDGWLDGWRGEECDDGNDADGDGCENDCRWTCAADEACHETPDDACTADTCVALDPPERGRACEHAPVPEGETCDFADDDCDGEVDEGTTRPALEPGPSRVTSTPAASRGASLAWNTANYLVAWMEGTAGAAEIRVQRISAAGSPFGDVRRVDAVGAAAGGPALIWTPTRWAVAWVDARRGGSAADAYLATLDTAGVRADPERVLSGASAEAEGAPDLEWTGGGFAAVWADARGGDSDVWFRRAGEDGTPDPSGEVRITDAAGSSVEPRIAWTGSMLALAWIDGRGGGAGEEQIRFLNLDAGGSAIGVEKAVTTSSRDARDLDVAASGSGVALAWTDGRSGTDRVLVLILDPEGTPLGAEFSVTDGTADAGGPSVAWAGSEWEIGWSDTRWGGSDPVAAWLGPAASAVTGETRVASDPAPSSGPSLAAADSAYGLAWTDERDGNPEVYFARVGCGP